MNAQQRRWMNSSDFYATSDAGDSTTDSGDAATSNPPTTRSASLERAAAILEQEDKRLMEIRAELGRERAAFERERKTLRVKILQEAADACRRAAEKRELVSAMIACLACADEIEVQIAAEQPDL